ncbi:MAG: hypothetical protein KF830_16405 [Planctomycetes bacterium]|nr:hypothetical protein [Planctomycetota bacterium]
MRRARGLLLAAVLAAACTTVGRDAVEARLVGRYEWWFIDSGRYLELAADGTWREGDVGMGAIFLTWCGRWRVAEGRVELQFTHVGGRDEPELRLPLAAALAEDYPQRLTVVGDGQAMGLRPDGHEGVPWQRVAAVHSMPR